MSKHAQIDNRNTENRRVRGERRSLKRLQAKRERRRASMDPECEPHYGKFNDYQA